MAISQAESVIMDVLWQNAPQTADEITAQIAEDQNWTAATVKSLLSRLLKKQAITATKKGRTYHYEPLVERNAYLMDESQGLLDRLFEGRVAPFVAHFSQQKSLSKSDIVALRKLIEGLDDE